MAQTQSPPWHPKLSRGCQIFTVPPGWDKGACATLPARPHTRSPSLPRRLRSDWKCSRRSRLARVSLVPSARPRGPATAFPLPAPWASATTPQCEVSCPRPGPRHLYPDRHLDLHKDRHEACRELMGCWCGPASLTVDRFPSQAQASRSQSTPKLLCPVVPPRTPRGGVRKLEASCVSGVREWSCRRYFAGFVI